ncbi:MAG: hypothetical protein IJG16_04805, partial [Clostridia bacterium]|nr:hypothetical protein [Clostridia bacterium]
VLSSNGLTTPQQLRVRASKGSAIAYVPISVVAANQFEITGLGYDGGDEKDTNEGKQRTVNKKHLVRLYVNKLGDYRDDVVFIMTLFDGDGKLAGSYSKKTSGKSLQTGESNEVAIDYNLPAEFNENTWTAKVMAWTSLTTNKEPEELVSTFSANYNNGTVTLSNQPTLTGKRTVAIYNPGTTDSQLVGDTSEKIAYISQSETEITSISDLSLAPGTYTVAIGGSMSDGSYAVHRATFTVSAQ